MSTNKILAVLTAAVFLAIPTVVVLRLSLHDSSQVPEAAQPASSTYPPPAPQLGTEPAWDGANFSTRTYLATQVMAASPYSHRATAVTWAYQVADELLAQAGAPGEALPETGAAPLQMGTGPQLTFKEIGSPSAPEVPPSVDPPTPDTGGGGK